MKKSAAYLTAILISVSALNGFIPGSLNAKTKPIVIKVKGKKITFKNKVYKNKKNYSAPAKELIKALKVKYSFRLKGKRIIAGSGKSKLIFTVGSKKVKVGKKTKKAGSAALLRSGVPYVDVVFTAKHLGYKYIKYTKSGRNLNILKKKPGNNDNTEDSDDPGPKAEIPEINPYEAPLDDIVKLYIWQDYPSQVIKKYPMAAPRPMTAAAVKGSDNMETLVPHTAGTIEGRGNSTWGAAQGQTSAGITDYNQGPVKKAPFKLVFPQKVDMLGMGAAKKWVLLANRYDKTLIRNAIAFDIGAALFTEFSPRYRFVNLYLNGDYKGLYMVTDQIEEDDIRVNIKNENKSDTEPAFLLEWDHKVTFDNWMYNAGDVASYADRPIPGRDYFEMQISQNFHPFVYKYPKAKDLDTAEGDKAREYIMTYMENASDAMINSASGEFEKYIDVRAFYDYFIVNDFMYNYDCANHSSIFMYKRKDGKLRMGPIWDFDISSGATAPSVATNWDLMNGGNPWYAAMIKNNSVFKQGLKDRWNEVKSIVRAKSIDSIYEIADSIRISAETNHARWGELTINVYDGENSKNKVPLPGTYQGEVERLREWMIAHYNWMDNRINKL